MKGEIGKDDDISLSFELKVIWFEIKPIVPNLHFLIVSFF